MKSLFSRFFKDESGATAVEYALLAAVIGAAVVAGAGAFGNSLTNSFTSLGSKAETKMNAIK